MQRYTIFFITVNAAHVSGGFSAHHQELKNCKHSIGCMSSLLAATASVGCLRQPTLPLSIRINTGSLYRNVSILNYKRDKDNVS